MMDNWEAQIIFHPGKVANGIYLSRKREYRTREFLRSDNTIVTVKEGEPNDGDLEFAWLDDDQMRALVAAFDKHGIKPPDAGFTLGKLTAVEKHLEDMRTLALSKYKEKK